MATETNLTAFTMPKNTRTSADSNGLSTNPGRRVKKKSSKTTAICNLRNSLPIDRADMDSVALVGSEIGLIKVLNVSD